MKIKYELEKGAKMPTKAHELDAGFDLYLHKVIDRHYDQPAFYDTGVHIEIPRGYVGLVLPRSSINAKGIICPVGVIDSGYTGTVKVLLFGMEFSPYSERVYPSSKYIGHFRQNERIAQLVILPLPTVELIEGDVTGKKTARGAQGFGSTGK